MAELHDHFWALSVEEICQAIHSPKETTFWSRQVLLVVAVTLASKVKTEKPRA